MTQYFNLTKEELQKLISLVEGIIPDIENRPKTAAHKIGRLSGYLKLHLEVLQKHEAEAAKGKKGKTRSKAEAAPPTE